jgi:CubicO group peptidase (beta-lactamase class C family)
MKKQMKKKIQRSLTIIAIILMAVLIYAGYYAYQLAPVGAGYMAKMMCSHVFISAMDPVNVAQEDVYDPLLALFSYHVDYQQKSVTVSAPLGLACRTAFYRPCLGAVLSLNGNPPSISEENMICEEKSDSTRSWPPAYRVDLTEALENVDREMLKKLVEEAFSEPDPQRLRRTRAVVIVYKGKIIAEQYAAPFDEKTPLIGWSMTKSITNALVGILVSQGKLSLDKSYPLPVWQDSEDPRRQITLEQLLRMSSGLLFDESYANPLSDVVVMLFNSPAAGNFAADKPLLDPPGSRWAYSSGTTNIISQIIRRTFNDNFQEYLEFPYKSLFYKIGMYDAMMETDPEGTFVGSSFAYATARDWARFGLLYLRDGVWNGERILPEGWVDFSSSRTDISKKGRYAAHFWLPPVDETPAELEGMYYASGHDGQYINIVPAHDLVVVRLGLSKKGGWDQEQFVRDIIRTLN